MSWLFLNQINHIDSLIDEDSFDQTIVFFKHSTICPISDISFKKMEAALDDFSRKSKVYLIKVIEERPFSNYIAEKLDVTHQSPQILVVKEGKCIFSESHLQIQPQEIFNLL
jgi:bacillithiol system protein YtxJ